MHVMLVRTTTGGTDTPVSPSAPVPVTLAPSGDSGVAIEPVVTPSADNGLVIKASAGNLHRASAQNLTATAGWFVLRNAATEQSDGAMTGLMAARYLAPFGHAEIEYAPPAYFDTGIVAVVTSAATPYTQTTGVITAVIEGSAS